jgi:hypothetical protein
MPKYYIKSGSLELIFSTSKAPLEAAIVAIGEINQNDCLHEYFYIDERGMKDYATALPDTIVIDTKTIQKLAGMA